MLASRSGVVFRDDAKGKADGLWPTIADLGIAGHDFGHLLHWCGSRQPCGNGYPTNLGSLPLGTLGCGGGLVLGSGRGCDPGLPQECLRLPGGGGDDLCRGRWRSHRHSHDRNIQFRHTIDSAQKDALRAAAVSIAKNLKDVLHRLQGNTDSPADRELAQRSLVNGSLFISSSDQSVMTGGDTSGVVVIGDQNRVVVHVKEEAYSQLQNKLFAPPAGLAPPVPSLHFIGRGHDIQQVKSLIGIHNGANRQRLVIIEGWPGVGKSSLAAVIGRDVDVLAAFPDGVLWTALGPSPNLFSSLAAWGRALGVPDLLRLPTLDEVARRLNHMLSSRRMLLIVDDVWQIEHATSFLQACSKSCTMVITTRAKHVSEGFTTTPSVQYRLPVLEEEDALLLLWTLAPQVVNENPDICRALVRDLDRLPLALHVAGRLLRSEATLGWGIEDLVMQIRSGAAIIRERAPEDRAENGSIPTVQALLAKSTDLLKARTREYFAYLGVFAPKPATFDLDALSTVWQEQDPKVYVRELVAHGLLEPAAGGRFQMHALLVAHALSLLGN